MLGINTNAILSYFHSNKIVVFPILASMLFLLASLVFIAANFSQLPPEIPIFYSTKTQILAGKNLIFLMPVIIFTNLLVNLVISKVFFSKLTFLAQILLVAQTLVAFLVFWAEVEIVLLF